MYINDVHVYDKTIGDIFNYRHLSFPCNLHKYDIISYALHYYVIMRMKQVCKQVNHKHKISFTNKLNKV